MRVMQPQLFLRLSYDIYFHGARGILWWYGKVRIQTARIDDVGIPCIETGTMWCKHGLIMKRSDVNL